MRQLQKKDLDELLRLTRSYWRDDCEDLCAAIDARIALSREMMGNDWLAILNLADGILGGSGLCKNASNEKFYEVLHLLGWEVVDDDENG